VDEDPEGSEGSVETLRDHQDKYNTDDEKDNNTEQKNTEDIAQNNTNILKAEDNRNDGMSQKPSVSSGSPGVFAERILV
jgi:hypothetical protein